ncbi:MAG TPA: SRPBCC domain-containing protein [Ramlibacter sp.]|nr:SRPBCC domain-containing protein [Ramlibacter sp.]
MAESPLDQKPELRITRRYPVAPEKVWRAWTEPQALARWFGPADTGRVISAELDVREGGAYSIAFTTQDGQSHRVGGVYQEVVPPRRLVFSWAWQSTPERVSRVTVELRAVPEGTELQFLHERFFDQAARDGHARGWSGAFAKLDALFLAPGSRC